MQHANEVPQQLPAKITDQLFRRGVKN